jgi:hypothetical protein
VCGDRIDSTEEGHFCEACGCAVHNHRTKPDPARSDLCPFCGAESEVALERQKQETVKDKAAEATLRVSVGASYIWDGLGMAIGVLALPAYYFVRSQTIGPRIILIMAGVIAYGLGVVVYGIYVQSLSEAPRGPRRNRMAVFAVAGVWFVIAEVVGYTLWHG